MEKEKITNGQLAQLIIITIISTAYMYLPAITMAKVGHDAWLSVLLAIATGLIVFNIYLKLASKFPGQNLIEISLTLLGKPLGKLIGLLYVSFFFQSNAVIIREFAEIIHTYVLIKTPLVLFALAVVSLAAITTRLGLEVISRSNLVIAPIIYLSILITLAFVFKDLNADYLTPILAKGFKPVLKGAIFSFEWICQSFLVLMLLPHLNATDTTRKTLNIALGAVGFLLLIPAILTLSLFGPELTAAMDNPIYYLVRYIRIGGFIERIDILILVTWISGVFIKISIFFYLGCTALAQVIGLKEYQALTFPYASLLVSFSLLIFKNISEMIEAFSTYFPWYYLFFEFFIPILFLILSLVFKKEKTIQIKNRLERQKDKKSS